MKKRFRQILIPLTAAAFSAGLSMVSLAAGWTQENGEWYYYSSDGSKETDTFKKSGNNWFYLDSDGTMVTSSIVEQDGNYYYVNSQGAMVSNEWREAENEDDAWQEGIYYCDPDNGGRLVYNSWKYLTAEDDENDDRDGDGYWFYFQSNGKKVANTDSKRINGRKYRFNEYGAAQFDWYATPSVASSSVSSGLYYNSEDQCWLSTGWFKTYPDEDIDPEGYDEGEEFWYYADSKGELVTSQIKTINGQKYGFDAYGKMLYGLYRLTFDEDGKTILSADKIESESDLPDQNEDAYVYYFGDSPKEGAMKTGTCTLEIDGEKYYYKFRTSGDMKGAGVNGIDDGYIYIQGRRMTAESGSKYEPFTYNGNDYLINTSGKIMKNKTNVKDADDVYYCTDEDGIITYSGYDKYTD